MKQVSEEFFEKRKESLSKAVTENMKEDVIRRMKEASSNEQRAKLIQDLNDQLNQDDVLFVQTQLAELSSNDFRLENSKLTSDLERIIRDLGKQYANALKKYFP